MPARARCTAIALPIPRLAPVTMATGIREALPVQAVTMGWSSRLSAKIDEDEATAMLTAVTAEAIIRWGAGNRPAAWLQQALHDRVQVVLSGIARMGDKTAE